MNLLTWDVVERAVNKLNRDAVAADNLKRKKLTLTLACGETRFTIAIDDSRLRLLKGREAAVDADVTITGPSQQWDQILNGLHGGLHRAFRHKLLRFEGDAVFMLMIWKTIWRLGESLAAAVKEGH